MNSSNSLSTPSRGSNTRHHSHSISLGSINPTHRVTRRKSTNASSVNNASAVRAALHDMSQAGATSVFESNARDNRRSVPDFLHANNHECNSATTSLPRPHARVQDIAVAEGSAAATPQPTVGPKPRARRASEGSYLSKGEGRRASGELRCETCGKGYKHSSCLTKHLLVPQVSLTLLTIFALPKIDER